MFRTLKRCVLISSAVVLTTACGSADGPTREVEYAVQGIYSAAISNDARYAIVGSIQHGGSLWDANNHERLYNWNHKKDSYSNIVASAFSPDNQYAITNGHHIAIAKMEKKFFMKWMSEGESSDEG